MRSFTNLKTVTILSVPTVLIALLVGCGSKQDSGTKSPLETKQPSTAQKTLEGHTYALALNSSLILSSDNKAGDILARLNSQGIFYLVDGKVATDQWLSVDGENDYTEYDLKQEAFPILIRKASNSGKGAFDESYVVRIVVRITLEPGVNHVTIGSYNGRLPDTLYADSCGWTGTIVSGTWDNVAFLRSGIGFRTRIPGVKSISVGLVLPKAFQDSKAREKAFNTLSPWGIENQITLEDLETAFGGSVWQLR